MIKISHLSYLFIKIKYSHKFIPQVSDLETVFPFPMMIYPILTNKSTMAQLPIASQNTDAAVEIKI